MPAFACFMVRTFPNAIRRDFLFEYGGLSPVASFRLSPLDIINPAAAGAPLSPKMDSEEFRKYGRDMVDYIAKYMEKVGDMPPVPTVSPGYLKELIPDEAPEDRDNWEDVMKDIDRVIMPGVTHWHSSHFHAYFPTGNSFPAILGDMLSDAIGCIGFSWIASPACTELEVSMMNWLGKMIQLPSDFLFTEGGLGGGVIQGTASEATLVAILSARTTISQQLKEKDPSITQGQIIDKLVAYTSEESHSSVERAALIAIVKIRKLPTDERGSLRGSALEAAIKEDKAQGLIPFFLCATVGTTSSCAFDNIVELGPICNAYDIWMHVDAAYAGSACICPEFRPLIDGVENSMSINFNPHKWMRVNFDCSAMWVKNRNLISGAFEVDPLYLKHEKQGQAMPDYRHWQIPLGRRFRSIKLWFVMRMFGIKRLQEQIRKDVALAKQFEKYVREDNRFEIFGQVVLGLVCFRLKGDNKINEILNKRINEDRRIHLVPSNVKNTYFLRFAICGSETKEADVTFAWKTIQELATKLLEETKSSI